jgi:hypothetical protein
VDKGRDPVRLAVRGAKVKVEVNGESVTLSSGDDRRPISAGGVHE